MIRVLVLLLAGVTACSGGAARPAANSPAPSPSITVPGLISSTGAVPADYLTSVDAICASSLDLLARRPPPLPGPGEAHNLTATRLRALSPYIQADADARYAAAMALGHLAPPPAGVDEWIVFRMAVAQFAAATQAEATAAKAGAVPAFLAARQRILALRTKVLESGLAVGLGAGTACARLF